MAGAVAHRCRSGPTADSWRHWLYHCMKWPQFHLTHLLRSGGTCGLVSHITAGQSPEVAGSCRGMRISTQTPRGYGTAHDLRVLEHLSSDEGLLRLMRVATDGPRWSG